MLEASEMLSLLNLRRRESQILPVPKEKSRKTQIEAGKPRKRRLTLY